MANAVVVARDVPVALLVTLLVLYAVTVARDVLKPVVVVKPVVVARAVGMNVSNVVVVL